MSLSDQLCLSVSSSDPGLCEGLPINREEPQAAVPRSATLHKPPGTFHSGGGDERAVPGFKRRGGGGSLFSFM